jgi:hypothetical protein
MFGMIRRINAINDRLRAVNREITVQLDHGVPRVNQLGPVHLNFVVILSARRDCRQIDGHKYKREKAEASRNEPE